MSRRRFCQSCGYPMDKDKQGGGTEKDGSVSEKYCSMCYRDGEFLTPPEVTNARQMQKYCMDEMKGDGLNGLFAWLATRNIPKLERWNHS